MHCENGRERDGIEKLLITFLNSPSTRKNTLLLLLDMIPFGHHPFPYIERVKDPASRFQLRQNYSETLNETKLKYDLHRFLRNSRGNIDLEVGSFLISRLSDNHEITPEKFSHSLDLLYNPLIKILAGYPDNSIEKIRAFSEFLFNEKKFRGNTDDYYAPSNSFLSDIIETGLGNPVSLSVLSILIARRAGITLRGVNMPGHFILRFDPGDGVVFLDPFNGGKILSEKDYTMLLIDSGIDPSPHFFSAVGNIVILKRMYRNLINYHSVEGDYRKEMTLRQHFSILEDSSLSH